MKKIIFTIIGILLIIGIILFTKNLNKKENNLTKITVAEVAHSIFYIPQYMADAKGFFKEEGLDVNIVLASGADKVTAAVLSGDVQIGFCGSEATIYIYNQGEKDYLVNFAGLTKRDGSFIVSRKKINNFKLEDMKGKKVIAGRIGGMPEMTFEWALREKGISPTEVDIDTSIAFPAMSGAFIGGTGDFVNLFEPQALQVEKQGYGYVVASLGELGGIVPYTAYNAKKSYIENNKDTIQKFTNAIQRGLDYVHNTDSKEIASNLIDYFPDISLNDLIEIVDRYKKNDSWFETTYIEKENFEHIEEIMKKANQLNENVKFEDLVDNSFSKKKAS